MGVDIHLHIINGKASVKSDIFPGRSSDWFNKLQGRNIDYDPAYNNLPTHYGLPDEVPWFIEEDKAVDGYYGFHYMNVKAFKDWFMEWRPDMDAGWATTYERWMADHKPAYVPEVKHELSPDDIIADMCFIEVHNIYDCSFWLYNYLINNNVSDDYTLIYYFDC